MAFQLLKQLLIPPYDSSTMMHLRFDSKSRRSNDDSYHRIRRQRQRRSSRYLRHMVIFVVLLVAYSLNMSLHTKIAALVRNYTNSASTSSAAPTVAISTTTMTTTTSTNKISTSTTATTSSIRNAKVLANHSNSSSSKSSIESSSSIVLPNVPSSSTNQVDEDTLVVELPSEEQPLPKTSPPSPSPTAKPIPLHYYIGGHCRNANNAGGGLIVSNLLGRLANNLFEISFANILATELCYPIIYRKQWQGVLTPQSQKHAQCFPNIHLLVANNNENNSESETDHDDDDDEASSATMVSIDRLSHELQNHSVFQHYTTPDIWQKISNSDSTLNIHFYNLWKQMIEVEQQRAQQQQQQQGQVGTMNGTFSNTTTDATRNASNTSTIFPYPGGFNYINATNIGTIIERNFSFTLNHREFDFTQSKQFMYALIDSLKKTKNAKLLHLSAFFVHYDWMEDWLFFDNNNGRDDGVEESSSPTLSSTERSKTVRTRSRHVSPTANIKYWTQIHPTCCPTTIPSNQLDDTIVIHYRGFEGADHYTRQFNMSTIILDIVNYHVRQQSNNQTTNSSNKTPSWYNEGITSYSQSPHPPGVNVWIVCEPYLVNSTDVQYMKQVLNATVTSGQDEFDSMCIIRQAKHLILSTSSTFSQFSALTGNATTVHYPLVHLKNTPVTLKVPTWKYHLINITTKHSIDRYDVSHEEIQVGYD